MRSALTEIPNVGPAVARALARVGIAGVDDLRDQDADDLFERLCVLDGRRHDPCLRDTFSAAVDDAGGGPARPWWGVQPRAQGARACLSCGRGCGSAG